MSFAVAVAAIFVCLCGCAEPTTLKGAYAGHYLIGTCLTGTLPGAYSTKELALIKAQFNVVTPENCMKPQPIHPAENTWNFAQADALVAFARENQMRVIGHTLVWHSQTPRWFFQGVGGKAVTREVALARMQTHIQTEMEHFKGQIKGWDVVNEALADDGSGLRKDAWRQAIGDDYVAQAFFFAHAADPKAELHYNDYNIETGAKHAAAMKLLRSLKAAGAPITAVGIQGHWILDHIPFGDIDKAISDFHSLGLKVMITELDVDVLPRAAGADVSRPRPTARGPTTQTPITAAVLQRQAEQYAKLFRIFEKHRDAITRVTFWGLTDGRSWLNTFPTRRTNYPMLFDRQCEPKPAFGAVMGVAAGR